MQKGEKKKNTDTPNAQHVKFADVSRSNAEGERQDDTFWRNTESNDKDVSTSEYDSQSEETSEYHSH
jgi:hypothetical protein